MSNPRREVLEAILDHAGRVAISITSGSGLRSKEAAMAEDRRALGMAESIETAERLFIEDFDTWGMTGYYLYSKLLRSGVSGHVGTGGSLGRLVLVITAYLVATTAYARVGVLKNPHSTVVSAGMTCWGLPRR